MGTRERHDRNWYKAATIVLTSAMVLLTFLSVVYYRRVDREQSAEQSEQQLLDAKLDELKARREAVRRLPKISVQLSTLRDSGLPESAFSPLPRIPAVVGVQHVEGRTAHGITVRVDSEALIESVEIKSSIEDASYRITEDKKSVLIEIPKLRKGTSVEVTLMQSALGDLTHETRLDVGELVGESSKQDSERRIRVGRWLSDPLQIPVSALDSTAEINEVIELLTQLRDRSKRAPSKKSGMIWAIVKATVLALLAWTVIFTTSMFVSNTLDSRKKRRLAVVFEKGGLKPGITIEEALTLVGDSGRDVWTVEESDDVDQIWRYSVPSHFSLGPNSPGAVLLFSAGVLVKALRLGSD